MRRLALVLCLFTLATPSVAERLFVLGAVEPAEQSLWNRFDLQPESIACPFASRACLQPIRDAQSAPLVIKPGSEALFSALVQLGLEQEQVSSVVLWNVAPDWTTLPADLSNSPAILLTLSMDATAETARLAREFVDAWYSRGGEADLFMFPADGLAQPADNPIVLLAAAERFGRDINQPELSLLMELARTWDRPPINHDAFLADPSLLATFPGDTSTGSALAEHYRVEPFLRKQWSEEPVTGFDLLAWRDRIAPGARYATLTNLRGEELYLDLDQYSAYEPYITVGIGGIDNLYRMSTFYQVLLQYSWTDAPAPLSVRVLGPLLIFRQPLPPELKLPLRVSSALTLDGIAFSDTDPLTGLADVPEPLRPILQAENGCVHCHATNVTRPSAHHLDAFNASPQGGFALPLADYPDDVIRQFIYEQQKSADAIGMTPNFVDPARADAFYDWIVSLRTE